MKLLFLAAALAAGMLAPIQAGMNARVGQVLKDPFYAALVSFFVGTAGLVVFCLARGMDFSRITQGSGLHWSFWTAGLLGVFYVTATLFLTPKLGAALTFSLVVAGQLIMALAMDHFGTMGIPVHPVSWVRILGIALVIAGVALIRRF